MCQNNTLNQQTTTFPAKSLVIYHLSQRHAALRNLSSDTAP